MRVAFAIKMRLPILSHFILHVVVVGSEEKMRGADTSRIIAMVKYMETIRDQPMRQFPYEAVSTYFLAIDLNSWIARFVG